MKRFLLVMILLIYSMPLLYGSTIQTQASGKWDSVGTWKGGIIPSDTDKVDILSGHTVTVNVDFPIVQKLTIQNNAVLQFDGVKNRIITSTGDIVIDGGGKITPSGTFNIGDALNNIQLKGNLIVNGIIEGKKLGILSGSRTINYINFQPNALLAKTTVEGSGTIGASYFLIGKSSAADTVTIKPGVTISVQEVDIVKGTLDNSKNNISANIVARYDNGSTIVTKPNYIGFGYVSYPGVTNITTGTELPDSVGSFFTQYASKVVTLNKNAVVTKNLFLMDGRVNTGQDTLKVTGTVSNSGNGFVIGSLEKPITDSMKTFEVGTANGYGEVIVKFYKLVGSITPRSLVVCNYRGMHKALNDTMFALRRYWRIVKKGNLDFYQYDITLRYSADDFVNNIVEKFDETSLLIGKYNPIISAITPINWQIPKLFPENKDSTGEGGTIKATNLNGLSETGIVEFVIVKPGALLTVENKSIQQPTTMKLSQNYPNPFNPTTVINYQIPMNNRVTLKVYDVIGREVATLVNEMKEAGNYSAAFDGTKYSSGIYFVRLESANQMQLKKILMIK